MKIILSILITTLLLSCSQQKNPNEELDNNVSETSSCYRYTTAADTIVLNLIRFDTTVVGSLIYKLREKDQNFGTIEGHFENDILVADYNFFSEGVESTRRVAFKIDGDALVEGYGDLENISSLDFTDSVKLLKVDCK